MTLNDFLAMGGYADYVWSSYAIVFVVLIGLLITHYKQFRKQLKNIVIKKEPLSENIKGRGYAE